MLLRPRFRLLGWLGLLLLAVSCNADRSGPEQTITNAPAPQLDEDAHGLPPVAEELPELVARVNDRHITGEELERAVRSAEIQAGQALPAQFRDQVYRSVLDRLVSFHLLIVESETRNLSVDDPTVNARIDQIRAGFADEMAFESQLESWNTTLTLLRQETHRDLLVEQVLESAVFSEIEISVDTVHDFYDQHSEQFTEGGGVRIRHILLRLSPTASEEDKATVRERAETLRLEAEHGADFAALAREHSEDPESAANGGDLGVVVAGQTMPAFEQAAFSLEPGELSNIVETPFGLHIIQLVGREEPTTVAFEEARAQIHEFLLLQAQQAGTVAFIEELKANYDVEILI